MGFLRGATLTLIGADGTEILVEGTFDVTGATEKGEVSLVFTPVTGDAVGVPISLTGKAGIDGSIALGADVLEADVASSLDLVSSSASVATVAAVDPLVTADIKGLASAVKATKAAEREFRLALQEEAAAKIDADTTSTNRGVLNRAIQLVADMQDVLDSITLTSSQKITRIGELKTVLAGLSLQVGASVITDLLTALNTNNGVYTETQKLASFSSAVAQATTDIAIAKTSAESRDVAAQTRKEKTAKQVPVAKKKRGAKTKVATKAVAKLVKERLIKSN